jgi:hypothetical protein
MARRSGFDTAAFSGDGTSDARQAPVGLAVPEEAMIRHGHMVGCSAPFALTIKLIRCFETLG